MSFGKILTYPFSWLLLTFYELTGNYGVSVLVFALVVKLILLPFQMKSKRSTMRTARLSPILKDLEKKCGDDKQKYQKEVAKFYKEEKINPMSGCLWSIIPFPILIALYSVIRQPLTRLMCLTSEQVATVTDKLVSMNLYAIPEKANAYSELTLANLVHENYSAFQGISDKLIDLDFSFLGMNLGLQPQWNFFSKVDWSNSSIWGPALGLFLIPVISALLSYFAMKVSNTGNPAMAAQQQSMKGMMLFMPFISLYIGFVMPAALGIYWIAGSALGIIQDSILNRHYGKILDAEDEDRRKRMYAREEELERKHLETEKLREIGATERNKNTSKKKLQAVEKAQQEERLAAEKARRKAELGIEENNNVAQVGNRKFARGRAYNADRFDSGEVSDADEIQTETFEQTDNTCEDEDNS